MTACIIAIAFVHSRALALSDLSEPALWPWHLAAAIQFFLAGRHNQLWRSLLPITIEAAAIWQMTAHAWPIQCQTYFTIHSAIIALLLTAALLSDRWSQYVRLIGAALLPLAAIAALAAYDQLFPLVPRALDNGYVSILAVIAFIYWYRTATIANLTGACTTVTLLALMHLRQLAAPVTTTILAEGRPWLAWGAAFLIIAVVISAFKAGAGYPIASGLAELNERLRNFTKEKH
jgi:hypothetical protein